MVAKKCPKCGRVAHVRVERTYRATEYRSSYSCSACGATWTSTARTDRKPSKRRLSWIA